MNCKFKVLAVLASIAVTAALCGCSSPNESGNESENGTTTPPAQTTPVTIKSILADDAEKVIGNIAQAADEIPADATEITGKITIEQSGNYYVNSDISGKKITVESEGVTLYLSGATLSNEKKVIESSYPLTITLFGENNLSNSNAAGSNAIDCAGKLIVNGSGSLTINSTKNGIKANSLSVIGATLNVIADNDGLHAEVDDYDTAVSEPSPSYDDGGYVYLNNAKVTVNSGADGIQADTFVYISESTVNITSGGGAPETPANDSSDKGIKAGAIDWGADETDLVWDGYLVHITDSKLTINSADDAIHSDFETNLQNSEIEISTGGDAVHADKTINVCGVNIEITKCFNEYEAETINMLDEENS